METVGVEGAVIVDAQLPEEGKQLEARYGRIPWLHYASELITEHPPNPLRAPQPERLLDRPRDLDFCLSPQKPGSG